MKNILLMLFITSLSTPAFAAPSSFICPQHLDDVGKVCSYAALNDKSCDREKTPALKAQCQASVYKECAAQCDRHH